MPDSATFRLTIASLQSDATLRKRLQICFPVIGTGIASALQIIGGLSPAPWDLALKLTGVVLAVVVMAVAVLLVLADKNGPETLAAAHAAQEGERRVANDNGRLSALIEENERSARSVALLYVVASALRSFISPLVSAKPMSRATAVTRVGEMIDIVLAQKQELLGFGDERWNVAVYLPDAGGALLECFACRRPDRTDEQSEHRSWPKGTGHVGRTFHEGRELVVPDAQLPVYEDYFRAPPNHARAGNSERYRSMASVPIADGDRLLGVLIATSDVPGRFTRGQNGEQLVDGRDTVEPLRILARNIAIVVMALEQTPEEQDHA